MSVLGIASSLFRYLKQQTQSKGQQFNRNSTN